MSRFAFVLVAGCALAPAGSASAAGKGDVQPDSLPFGTLHTGGTAEGSFMLFAAADDPNPKIKVDAPKFVKVLHTGTHAQTFGNKGAFTCVTVEVAIDTAEAGEFKGEIVVTAGETTAKLPLSATVKARKAGAPRVLVVGSPFAAYATSAGKDYKGWTDVVDAAGVDASYVFVRENKPVVRDIDLSTFDCVLLADYALVFQTADDVRRVRAYAENGGRVVVSTSSATRGTLKGANAVLGGSGIEMLDQEPAPAQIEVTLTKDEFAAEVVKAGVGSVTFFRGSPAQVEKGGRVLVNAIGFNTPGLGFAATAKVGKGEMTALGVPLWWYWVSEGEGKGRANGSDNGKLLGWLLAPPKKG